MHKQQQRQLFCRVSLLFITHHTTLTASSMDAHYYQRHVQSQQGYGQPQGGQSGQQEYEQQQRQQHSMDPSYYQSYQQYYNYPQQHQTPSASNAALPPSYSTPLPPAKSRQQGGSRRGHNHNPLEHYQRQYQSSTQMGVNAASALTAALFQYGGSSSSGSTTTGTTETSQQSHPQHQQRQEHEWYSDYHTPTLQQRMAATVAMNVSPPERLSQDHQGGRRNNSNHQNNGNNRHNQHPRHGRNNNGRNNNHDQRNRHHQQQRQPRHQHHSQLKTEPINDPSSTVADATSNKDPNRHHCDACDVTFHEEAKLKVHLAAHRSCPQCQYSASPSLVSDHIKVAHGPKKDESTASTSTPPPSGQSTTPTSAPKPRIPPIKKQAPKPAVSSELLHPLAPTLNTPEDIAAWIAQRRRAWPTQANIDKREQERQEMIAKGQVVEDPKSFNGKDKKRSRNGGGLSNTGSTGTEDAPTKKAKTDGSVSPNSNPGIEESPVACGSPTETSEGEREGKGERNEDEDNENETMDPVKDAVTSKDPNVMGKILLPNDRSFTPTKPCRYFMQGKCTRGDQCTFLHDPSFANKTQKTNPASPKKTVFRNRPSLLQMLLAGEIKDEKNKLLEAMRYIVESNFFEKQQTSSGPLVEEVA